MNTKRGLLRIWVVFSIIWLVTVAWWERSSFHFYSFLNSDAQEITLLSNLATTQKDCKNPNVWYEATKTCLVRDGNEIEEANTSFNAQYRAAEIRETTLACALTLLPPFGVVIIWCIGGWVYRGFYL